jgi:putative MATE family efflux protein
MKTSLESGDAEATPPIDRTKIRLLHLTWPIFVENVLRISLASVDVFMLSFYSEKAVAAVGLINQFVFFMQLLYLMVAVGASILISQNLGARREKEAGQIALGSISLGIMFAALLSVTMALSANRIVGFYRLDPVVHRYACQFLFIYSLGSVFTSLGMVQSAILRVHGHSREPMMVNIAANIINVFGNYLFIFGPLGIPKLGVVGVALSTVFSQAIACLVLAFRIKARRDVVLPFRKILRVPHEVFRRILSVGVPTAGENLSYTIGQIIIMRIISSMGTDALTASVYALTILRFVFMTSVSIGTGTQIKVGYWVGAKMHDVAYRKVLRYFGMGFCISLFLVTVLFVFQAPVMHIFTKNPSILHLMAGIWIVSLLLEPARNFNVIIIPALKGAGDVRYPVYIGMLLMWGVGVVFAYVFGISLHWGLMGVWIAMTCDEWIRGVVMLFRWKSGKWRTKTLVAAVA